MHSVPSVTPQPRTGGIIPAALSLLFLALSFVDVMPSTGQRVYYSVVILACACLVLFVWRRVGVLFRWFTTVLCVVGIAVSISYLIV